jgi:hypothetical protein
VEISEKLLSENPYSRSGKSPRSLDFIVMQWVETPRMTATALKMWEFWEQRKDGALSFGGGHYVVDQHGALRCAQESEMIPHVGTANGITPWALERFGNHRYQGYSSANYHCLAVEMCNIDTEGSYPEETYDNAVELVADLCRRHNRSPFRDIFTHNLGLGWKECPRWFVHNPGELERFRWAVAARV